MTDRSKNTLFTQWWLRLDRPLFWSAITIMGLGIALVATASPAVAERIGLDQFFFLKRQIIFTAVAVMVMIGTSYLSARSLFTLSIAGLLIGYALMILVMFIGFETKGAQRWIYIAGISLQPSEFVKPFFIIVSAWLMAKTTKYHQLNGTSLSILLYLSFVGLLILQPDFGMTVVVSVVWAVQLFLSGITVAWISACVVLFIVAATSAYLLLPHVAERINNFILPSQEANYQVTKSLAAFRNGNWMGTGPGEGSVKQHLPDSHSDFIFAVAGEELGAIVCILIVALYAFIVLRGLLCLLKEHRMFVFFAAAGLLIQFSIQAMVNIGVTLHLLPTKGMTLPFISYGGSSTLASALTMGMILALTKRRYGNTHSRKKIMMESIWQLRTQP